MRKMTIFLLLFSVATTSYSQRVEDGWYLFKYPVSNVFGIGYNKPKMNREISSVGAKKIELSQSDFIIQKGPDRFYDLKNHWKNIVITSLFNKSNNIQVTVDAYKLKRVILDGDRWRKFGRDNYYITEGIKSDSVFITAKIIDTTGSDSKDLQTIISTFAAEGTVAIKVVNALSPKDSTKTDAKGIVQYKSTKNDSLSIIIKDPDVFFASKFVQFNTNAADAKRRAPDVSVHAEESQTRQMIGNEYTIMYKDYNNIFTNGATVKLVLQYQEENKLVNLLLKSQPTGEETEEVKPIKAIKLKNNEIITFDGEYPFLSDVASTGIASSQKYLTIIDYKFDFNPNTRALTVYGYQNGEYQTCIYQIKNKIKYWPQ
jgi:hypothetical protein